jgi:uncharacterized protein
MFLQERVARSRITGTYFHLRSAAMTGKFAIVTGASTGIGLELARCGAKDGYDLLIAADEAAIEDAPSLLRQEQGAANILAIEADLATTEGLDKLVAAAAG